MTQHQVGTREEWLAARKRLLEREQELNRQSDELARQRRELPWVRVEKEYRFDTDEGTKNLTELFDGRSQLLVYHLMFGPDWANGSSGSRVVVPVGSRSRAGGLQSRTGFLMGRTEYYANRPLSEINGAPLSL